MVDYTRGDVALLLRRSGFFSAPDAIDALLGEPSWAAVVDRVLDTSANPAETIPPEVADPNTPLVPAIIAGTRYWMDRMVTSPTPIVEKVAFFWHGVLTSAVPNPSMAQVFAQIATWRARGLGDVHDLMQAMAVDPAMLDYLDNADNRKASPNENFARELMELFTMGNFSYTEEDVVGMARAWTGHNLQYATGQYVFRPTQHDDGPKTIFGITRNWDGPETITEIVRGSKQPVCARYLAGRLWSSFVAPDPPDALLDELRDAFIAAGMDVRELLRVIFRRPEFRSPDTRTALVRSPVEWEVAIVAATGVTLDALGIASYQQRLGQVLYRPPNVSGWRQNRAWISSSAMWAKGEIATNLQAALASAGTFDAWASLPVADAVAAAFDRFGVDAPSAATRAHLEAFVAAERAAGRGAVAPATLGAVMTLTPDFQLA